MYLNLFISQKRAHCGNRNGLLYACHFFNNEFHLGKIVEQVKKAG